VWQPGALFGHESGGKTKCSICLRLSLLTRGHALSSFHCHRPTPVVEITLVDYKSARVAQIQRTHWTERYSLPFQREVYSYSWATGPRRLWKIFPDSHERYPKLSERLPSIVVEPTESGDVESGELRWPPNDSASPQSPSHSQTPAQPQTAGEEEHWEGGLADCETGGETN
ncbi:hypothetical protein JZ751_010402, partial [Albula glossodonta]